MEYFNFCPNCQSANITFENNRKFNCQDCGMLYFHNVAAAVAVIIEQDDKILFTVRNRAPKKGYLDLPGGFTDPDETVEQTCQRELKEELNLDFAAEDFRYFKSQPNDYDYRGIPYKTADLIFIAQFPKAANIVLEKEEIEAYRWVPKTDINVEDIGFVSLQNAVLDYLTHEKL